jgi:hypothetical protein
MVIPRAFPRTVDVSSASSSTVLGARSRAAGQPRPEKDKDTDANFHELNAVSQPRIAIVCALNSPACGTASRGNVFQQRVPVQFQTQLAGPASRGCSAQPDGVAGATPSTGAGGPRVCVLPPRGQTAAQEIIRKHRGKSRRRGTQSRGPPKLGISRQSLNAPVNL